jgi:peptide deformylase
MVDATISRVRMRDLARRACAPPSGQLTPRSGRSRGINHLHSPAMAEQTHDRADHEIHGELAPEPETEDLEREARRLLALSRIRQHGDGALRMKAREVESFDDDLRRLVERMTTLMHEAQGVGLAATQVGVLRRVFVFVDEGEDRVLVNPIITTRSSEVGNDEEGCLSLRDVLVPVERPIAVTIEGSDARGEPVKLDLELPSARIVQHELDHLDGVLIIDRTDDESRRAALAKLRPQPVLGLR